MPYISRESNVGLISAYQPWVNETRQQWTVLSSYWRRPRNGGIGDLVTDPQDTLIGRVIRSGQRWESWLDPYFAAYCDPHKASLDIGANIGAHAVTMARLSSVVHAFEPQQATWRILARNAQGRPIVTHNLALSDREGTVRMKAPTGNTGMTEIDQAGTGEIVQVRRLDDIPIEQPVGLMKIDVEKHERECLAGALGTIERDQPVIILEDQVNARQELVSLGYRCSRISIADYLCLPPRLLGGRRSPR